MGDNNGDNKIDGEDAPNASDNSGDLWVEGNVGIGTVVPDAKLEVVGGSIKATGGLIIEVRPSNPSNPETGRMWLLEPGP